MSDVCGLAAQNPAQSTSDVELMLRVAKRDPKAQRELAERVIRRVRRLSYTLLQNAVDADDAAQQALVEILQSAHNFSAPGNLEAWTDTITVRTAIRLARRLRAQRSLFEQYVNPESLMSLVSEWRRKEITLRQLQAYLERIPPQKREAFVLKHALGYTVDEIATLTQSPRGTVKDRLVAARKQLRKMIECDVRLLSGARRSQ